jgi:hypothetical protein
MRVGRPHPSEENRVKISQARRTRLAYRFNWVLDNWLDLRGRLFWIIVVFCEHRRRERARSSECGRGVRARGIFRTHRS